MAGNSWGPNLIDFSPLGNLGKSFLDSYSKGKKEADEKRQTQELVRAYDRYSASGMSPLAPQPPMSPTSGSIGGAGGAGADMYPGTASLLRNESGGNWGARNDVVGAGGARGHFGRAQFGQARLNEAMQAGVIPPGTTPQQFMQSPEMQKNAESWHFGDIDNFIRQRGLDGVIGTLEIGGVPATMEGLRAVAHLGGKGGLQKFIESGGQYNPRDANGTSLMDYFRRHGGASSTRGSASDEMTPGMSGAGSDADVEAQPGMAASTFDAITGTLGPRTPAFAQAQAGMSQPWMGSTLGALGTQPQTAMTPLPPRRPNDLANVPARGAVPAIGQMPPQAPQMAAPQIDPNSPDAGSRTFAASQAYAPQMAAPQAPQMSPTSGAPGAGGGAGAGGAPQMATRQNVSRDMIRDLIAAGGTARQMGLQLWQQAMTGKNFGFQVVGDQLYRTDPRTGQVEPIQGVTKPPAPVTVGEGASLVDPRTGQVIFQGQPKKTEAAVFEERRAQAERVGLKPGDPAYQSFILTGKLPREDQAPLTATDKKAILEADEGVLAGETAIKALTDAKKISPRALGGKGASLKAGIANNVWDWLVPDGMIGSPEQGEATSVLENIVTSQALASLKAIFGAAPTDGERAMLMEIQGSIGQPDNVRQKIYDRGIAMAEAKLKFNRQRAAEMRGGTYYRPGAGEPGGARQGAPQQPRGQQPQARRSQPDTSQAKQAADGNWYVPDPDRPGKYLKVDP